MYNIAKLVVFLAAVSVCATAKQKAIQRPDGRVTAILTDTVGDDDTHNWMWPISKDESHRLTELLEQDFDALRILGTYVNTPILQCTKCGKDHEFIDWVYTALDKGFHTPEFIYEALKDGRTPKETKHDVYCSRCGALIAMRRRKGTPPEAPKVNKRLLREKLLDEVQRGAPRQYYANSSEGISSQDVFAPVMSF